MQEHEPEFFRKTVEACQHVTDNLWFHAPVVMNINLFFQVILFAEWYLLNVPPREKELEEVQDGHEDFIVGYGLQIPGLQLLEISVHPLCRQHTDIFFFRLIELHEKFPHIIEFAAKVV